MGSDLAAIGTVLPSWTLPGSTWDSPTGRLMVSVSPGLVGRLRRTVGSAPGLKAALLAGFVKVLHALTGETALLTGFASNAQLLACEVSVGEGRWTELLEAAGEALGRARPAASATATSLWVDLSGGPEPRDFATLHPGEALRVFCHGFGDVLAIEVIHRQDLVDCSFARRFVGYLLTALGQLVADPSALHRDASLLDPEEIDRQVHELSGPRRPDFDRTFVDLFEEQVRLRADSNAVITDRVTWTYATLDEHANRIADTLRVHGTHPGDVVAVVMERNADWVAAMLGVFKAGGVYLPARPDLASARLRSQLKRSGCRVVLTGAPTEYALRQSIRPLDGVAVITVEHAYARGSNSPRKAVVRPRDAAYIYFTSGSTGEPKGAVCEHLGMVNHLYAKLDDLHLTAADTVAQTASQGFDISLWQVVAPLMAGGSTEIIGTDLQVGVDLFVHRLSYGGIHVLDLVPSYLDVLVSELERAPRSLGDLRVISVGGEALKRTLVQRWFAVQPDIPLMNVYGATELSDVTMHAVLTHVPERPSPFVTLGRSIRNVTTYIMDERQRLVPLGAPGEITVSGPCVARGYVNDPQRSARSFLADPYRPTERLYRTGDVGRWLSEGTIEFLGRLDEQVKIHGHRIELGEIEHHLLRIPGVTDAAAIVDARSDQSPVLDAYITCSDEALVAELPEILATTLPDYMVPRHIHRLEALPLNDNGKVDKRELAARVKRAHHVPQEHEPPTTPTEARIAQAWAEVLAIPVTGIGRRDHFFQIGGSSLAAVKLVIALDRQLSLRDVVAHPVLADLAEAFDAALLPNGARPSDRQRQTLLQRLGSMREPPRAHLVCFPSAAGNASNFRELAEVLAPHSVAVHGVELPGHDPSSSGEPFADIATVINWVVGDVQKLAGPLLLWGQCAGAAPVLLLARSLHEAGRPPLAVVVASLLLAPPAELARQTAWIESLADNEVLAMLTLPYASAAASNPGENDPGRHEMVVAPAYRHDARCTNEALAGLQSSPTKLRVPLHVAVAGDDPTISDTNAAIRSWTSLAHDVRSRVLPKGGHDFVRSMPDSAAAVALDLLDTLMPREDAP